MNKLNNALTRRLEQYRQNAEEFNLRYPNLPAPATWRDCRYTTPATIRKFSPNNYGEDGQMYLDQPEDFPGVYEGLASDHINLDHTGWYTDDDTDIAELAKGAVFRIRTPDGIRYLSGIVFAESTRREAINSARVYLRAQFDELDDAARNADTLAESIAEDCWEANEKYHTEQRIEEAREGIHQLNKQALPLIREIKQAGKNFTPAICSALKDDVTRMLKERTGLFDEIAALQSSL